MEHPMKRLVVWLFLALCIPTVVGAGPSFRNAERWASIWDDPERDAWQKPLAVLEFLGIVQGETVADLGAGTGYFTRLLSIQVGAEGSGTRSVATHLLRLNDIDEANTTLVGLSNPDAVAQLLASEIDAAFEKERRLAKKKESKTLALIPLNLDGYLLVVGTTAGPAR